MIRSISRLAATSAALVMLAGTAFAAMAREVAIGSGMTRSFDAMTEPLLAQLQQMNVTRPDIKQDLDQVVNTLRPEVEQYKQQMVDSAARAFATRLSEADLKDIAAFYKSPAGVKFVQSQPAVLDDIVRDLATWSQKVSEYIMTRARAEMSKRGHQLQ
jgi:uncharacterized protein